MSKKKTKVLVEYTVKVFFDEDTKQYIGHCPELNYTGMGKTQDEALKDTQESIKTALDWCVEKKTIEQVLKESGYKAITVNKEPVWKPMEELITFKGNFQFA